MTDLKEIVLGILVLIYGLVFYIMGRTNFIEKVIVYKLNEITKSLKDDECEENVDYAATPNKEPVWEDTGYIVAAKESNHPGVKQGDVIILSPEEIEWVCDETVIKTNGRFAQVKEIQDGIMLCHLVFDLTETKRE